MDIAAMSVLLNQAKVQQQAGFSVMKMAMETGKTNVDNILAIIKQNSNSLEHSIYPHLGSNIDISL